MPAVSGLQAVAWGLLDGGVAFVTTYPGFYAHELAERLGVQAFSVNEKNALAIAWGASLAGIRSATLFKNVGLNDAADPYVNACMLGVRAGMVLVVLDDIDVEQSQIQQDSRPYADFPARFGWSRVRCRTPTNGRDRHRNCPNPWVHSSCCD
jgi:indolepyruvate ferredoxin oxidoreductase alpha subunit